METKVCFKCLIEKPLSDYYAHKAMADGHLNKCKLCTRGDTKSRVAELSKDPAWVKAEKERHRKKYHRLNYREKHKPTPEQKKLIMDRYKKRYPEKLNARLRSGHLKPDIEGNELHHWSYNEDHYKDVIELSVADHSKLHRYMSYDQERRMYRTMQGVLLDTREAHLEYYESIKDLD